MKKITIAIDGPAAAGKSTVAKLVAYQLDYNYIDTGAMYRALTLKALNNNIDVNDEDSLSNLLDNTTIEFHGNNVIFIDDVDKSKEIRSSIVTNNVSIVSKHKKVRLKMVELQRQLLTQGGVVIDGRDIGTYVCPEAELKIFQIATVESRAIRRFQEMQAKGINTSLEEVINDIKERDRLDSTREFAPLRKAHDAIEVDTTNMSIEQVVDKIVELAKERMI
ncbi:TPA: (d)CMP kinase [bacterium]|jgi:cytidylate kinase|nr:(d)CMP kinase [bacterium]